MGGIVSALARAVNSVPHSDMPPLCEYEAWLAGRTEQSGNGCGGLRISPSMYRRVAQLRRLGDSWAEIGRCTGFSAFSTAKNAWLRLPERLR